MKIFCNFFDGTFEDFIDLNNQFFDFNKSSKDFELCYIFKNGILDPNFAKSSIAKCAFKNTIKDKDWNKHLDEMKHFVVYKSEDGLFLYNVEFDDHYDDNDYEECFINVFSKAFEKNLIAIFYKGKPFDFKKELSEEDYQDVKIHLNQKPTETDEEQALRVLVKKKLENNDEDFFVKLAEIHQYLWEIDLFADDYDFNYCVDYVFDNFNHFCKSFKDYSDSDCSRALEQSELSVGDLLAPLVLKKNEDYYHLEPYDNKTTSLEDAMKLLRKVKDFITIDGDHIYFEG